MTALCSTGGRGCSCKQNSCSKGRDKEEQSQDLGFEAREVFSGVDRSGHAPLAWPQGGMHFVSRCCWLSGEVRGPVSTRSEPWGRCEDRCPPGTETGSQRGAGMQMQASAERMTMGANAFCFIAA